MRRLRALLNLWAFDVLTRWGIPARPGTLLTCIAVGAPLGIVPAAALGLTGGRFLAAVPALLPWTLLAALWQVWGVARVTLTQLREECVAPALAPVLIALDLPLRSWLALRFGLPWLAEAVFGGVFLAGVLSGDGSGAGAVGLALAVIAAGWAARVAVAAQLASGRTGAVHVLTLLGVAGLPAAPVTPGAAWPGVLGIGTVMALSAVWSVRALSRPRFGAGRTDGRPARRGRWGWRPLPDVVRTVVALRGGVWVPALRSLLGRTLALFALAAAVAAVVRLSVPVVAALFAAHSGVVDGGLAYVAFVVALGVAEVGIVWYGVRSRRAQLRAAWELGAAAGQVAFGSVLAHVLDGVVVAVGVWMLGLGLGRATPPALLLLPPAVVTAMVLGQAAFEAPTMPDGRTRTSLAGALAGILLAAPALLLAQQPELGALPASVVLLILMGGAAWMSQRTLLNASFSIA